MMEETIKRVVIHPKVVKWRLRPSRRPWLVSPIALTRLSPPVTTAAFRRPACSAHANLPGSRARRHRTSTRTGSSCASADSCRPGTAPGRYSPGANGPLCAKCSECFEYLSSTGTKKPSRLEWHVHPPYIPIRHRRAGSCAPIDRLHSAYGSCSAKRKVWGRRPHSSARTGGRKLNSTKRETAGNGVHIRT